MTTYYVPTGSDGKIEMPGPGGTINLDVTTTLAKPRVSGYAGR